MSLKVIALAENREYTSSVQRNHQSHKNNRAFGATVSGFDIVNASDKDVRAIEDAIER